MPYLENEHGDPHFGGGGGGLQKLIGKFQKICPWEHFGCKCP